MRPGELLLGDGVRFLLSRMNGEHGRKGRYVYVEAVGNFCSAVSRN